MELDAQSIATFYDAPIGQMVCRAILKHVHAHWSDLSSQRLLGLGFATPYLRSFPVSTERTVAAIPFTLGSLSWSPQGRNLVSTVEEAALPFADASFDRIFFVHGLELCESQRVVLRELWRVLTDNGRLIIVVPNRASLWAHFEISPFGHGHPYSRDQLSRLLEGALFHAEAWDTTLFMLPFGKRHVRRGTLAERVGRRLWPGLAGVHLVEVTKSLYAVAPPGAKPARSPVLAIAKSLTGSSSKSFPRDCCQVLNDD